MKRKIAILGAGAALALAGCGSDAPATTPSGTPAAPASGAPPSGLGPNATALAEELGVAVTKLDAAMQKIRESGGRPDDMAAALAQELGLSTAKVKAALEATRPQGAPEGAPPGGGQAAPADAVAA